MTATLRSHPATAATGTSGRLDARALAEATPDHRDRVVDLVRVAAVGVVVVGHWLLAVVTWEGDGLHARNLLDVEPWTRWATWPLQVMPLVFLAGGASNAASWASAQRRQAGYATWLRGRLERLVRPAVPLVAAWTAALAIASAAGVPPERLAPAARLVAMPLWFLAVYVAVVAAAPVALRLHDRHGMRFTAALAGLAALADLGPAAGHGWLRWTSFAWVWLLVHDLGAWWRDGRLTGAVGRVLLAGGVGAALVLTGPLGYPRSMVGVPGQRSNMTPPTVALVAVALAQVGALVLLRPRLERWLRRPRVWRRVVAANGAVMTAYLWHLTGLCLAVAGLLGTDLFPQPVPASAAWWATRPVWLVAVAASTAPLVGAAVGVEARRRPVAPGRVDPAGTALAVVAAGCLSVAFAVLALRGLPLPGRDVAWPVAAIGTGLVGGAVARRTALRTSGPPRAVAGLRLDRREDLLGRQ